MGENSITIGKDMFYGVIVALLAGLLVLSVFTQGFGIIKTPTQPTVPNPPTAPTQPNAAPSPSAPSQPSAPTQLTVDVGRLAPLGQSSAQVSVVEFSDFQCPFCGKLYNDAEAGIKTNYINSGKVKFYYRDFPLSFHPNAMPAAIAARCANDQGKFWNMHDKLFVNQQAWVGLSDAGATFKQYASDIGLDATKFATCYDGNQHLSEINADEAQGQQYGVQGTPGVFIIIPKSKISAANIRSAVSNGLTLYENANEYVVFVAGAYPYSAFDAVLSKISY